MTEQEDRQDSYYKILEFVEYNNSIGLITDTDLKQFKQVCRDNKYVSTYIRALNNHMDETKVNSIEDYNALQAKHMESKKFEDLLPWIIRNILEYRGTDDPVKIIRSVLSEALAREGSICDFKDSCNPDKKLGVCKSENHDDLMVENEDPSAKFNEETEEWEIEQVVEELHLTLYQTDESKFNDESTCYVCKTCLDDITENGDCEVSCDME